MLAQPNPIAVVVQRISIGALFIGALVSCQSADIRESNHSTASAGKLSENFFNASHQQDDSFLLASGEENTIRSLLQKGIKAVEDNQLEDASTYINLALKLDITNPDIQLFNGLVYHLMGLNGDATKFQLAEQGYQQALRFESGYLAAHYQLGLLYADQRRYSLAQDHFASVALYRNQDASVLYNLATASYYARDPKTAEAALNRLLEIHPNVIEKPEFIQAMTLVMAALNDRQATQKYLSLYQNISQGPRGNGSLVYRVEDWRAFYDSDAKVLLAAEQVVDPNDAIYGDVDGYIPSIESDTTNSDNSRNAYVDDNMVVVDVVLIGTQEDVRHSRGVNLLNGLRLQFGDQLTGTPAASYQRQRVNDKVGDSGFNAEEDLSTRTSLINIPAVSYSLNIVNSLNAGNRVLAKPSLIAQSGETSEFFSGTEILAAAVSGGNGDSVSVQKEVGVKLAVTPEMLPDDMLRLHVVAERTFLTDPSNSVVFEFRLDTTKTNINSTVTMKYGETLVLGGLSEREESKSVDGVPLLKDIPGLNLLFSERVQRTFERSIMILLTPRRPHFTQRSAEAIEKTNNKLSPLEKEIERLQTRHKNWFTPRPIFDEIIDKLQGPEFFKEFRIGDLKLISWKNNPNTHVFLESAKKRLLEI